MKTPGVYIVEKSAFPNTIVEVATAVPAFVGYTEQACNANPDGSFSDCLNKQNSLTNKPIRINSMAEFQQWFGLAPMPVFQLAETLAVQSNSVNVGDNCYPLSQSAGRYLLYYAMLLFYQNGGATSYIVSVGSYHDPLDASRLITGIDTLTKEQEPTMLVIPDAVLLGEEDCIAVQQAALAHCGGKMRNRVAILDVWQGDKPRQHPDGDCIANFRDKLGTDYLDFASAYYPWLNTSIVQERELSYQNIVPAKRLQQLLKQEHNLPDELPKLADINIDSSTENASAANKVAHLKRQQQWDVINQISADWSQLDSAERIAKHRLLHESLQAISPMYSQLLSQMRTMLNLLPPAAAMAGIYTLVDNTHGVWKAPANVSLSAVVSPAVTISHDEQEDLNVSPQGKSVNAIRSFVGEGTLVWGARTLHGNSLDWRYINVRRTMIMLEESIRLATKAYVFESNTANTWVTLKSMISHFLTGIWKRGGLAGTTPEDAFSVSVGLGETMTPDDILNGILRVTVLVALTRPAEFMEITLQQQMQKS
ncbi:phage tail sheath family protein [Rheinheimera baltica]|uniref:Phage tail sheath family protein n=1 Tax=Rheinheimera baltica TaxID=67576 RepID=A0ABT9HWV6_9GAMM|nr:phage tail sheath C-terminal domain-containing protein [Rheinheimera baltica]MDP5135300.1 phage tail sheath family protein [Rheinheimera baltica]